MKSLSRPHHAAARQIDHLGVERLANIRQVVNNLLTRTRGVARLLRLDAPQRRLRASDDLLKLVLAAQKQSMKSLEELRQVLDR